MTPTRPGLLCRVSSLALPAPAPPPSLLPLKLRGASVVDLQCRYFRILAKGAQCFFSILHDCTVAFFVSVLFFFTVSSKLSGIVEKSLVKKRVGMVSGVES